MRQRLLGLGTLLGVTRLRMLIDNLTDLPSPQQIMT